MSVRGRDLKVGSIFRNWRIVEEIGRGGMGVVYLAQHQLVGRHAAMKVLLAPADMRADESGMKRFQIEADLHFSLRHPNVPEFYDADLLEDGTAILIIEYLDGYDLAGTLSRLGKLALGDALFITSEILRPLVIVHGKSVHRDIKPSNIFLCRKPRLNSEGHLERGRVRLLDFGIAKLKGKAGPTKEHSLVGTLFHMSPEQLLGEELDGRSDQYAVGLVLFEMLAGRPLFIPDPDDPPHIQAVSLKHIQERPSLGRDLPGRPTDVIAFLAKLLEKKPADRFPHTEAALRAAKDLRGKYFHDSTIFTEEVDDVVKQIDLLQAERIKPPPKKPLSSGDVDGVFVSRVLSIGGDAASTDETPPPSDVRREEPAPQIQEDETDPGGAPAQDEPRKEVPILAAVAPSAVAVPAAALSEPVVKVTPLPSRTEPMVESQEAAPARRRGAQKIEVAIEVAAADRVRESIRAPRIFRQPALVQVKLGVGIFELQKPESSVGADPRADVHLALPSVLPFHAAVLRSGDGRLAVRGAPELDTVPDALRVDSEPISGLTELAHQARLSVGPASFVVTDLSLWDPRVNKAPRARASPPKIALVDVATNHVTASLPITASLTLVGSSPRCEFVVKSLADVAYAIWLRSDGELELLALDTSVLPYGQPVKAAHLVTSAFEFAIGHGSKLRVGDESQKPIPQARGPERRSPPGLAPPQPVAVAAPSPSPATNMVQVAVPSPGPGDQLVITGKGAGVANRLGTTFPVGLRRIVIGSAAGADVRIEHQKVSPQHAEIQRVAVGRYRVLDLGTGAGTFVNRKRVTESVLTLGDYLDVGGAVTFQLEPGGGTR